MSATRRSAAGRAGRLWVQVWRSLDRGDFGVVAWQHGMMSGSMRLAEMARSAIASDAGEECGGAFAAVSAAAGRRLGAYYVVSSNVEPHLHGFGVGTAMYRAAAAEASARGCAVVAGECAGFDTSEAAARVWGGSSFSRGAIVRGLVAYMPSPPAVTVVSPLPARSQLHCVVRGGSVASPGGGAWFFLSRREAEARAGGGEVASFSTRREASLVVVDSAEAADLMLGGLALSRRSLEEAARSSSADGCAVAPSLLGDGGGDVWLWSPRSVLSQKRVA